MDWFNLIQNYSNYYEFWIMSGQAGAHFYSINSLTYSKPIISGRKCPCPIWQPQSKLPYLSTAKDLHSKHFEIFPSSKLGAPSFLTAGPLRSLPAAALSSPDWQFPPPDLVRNVGALFRCAPSTAKEAGGRTAELWRRTAAGGGVVCCKRVVKVKGKSCVVCCGVAK